MKKLKTLSEANGAVIARNSQEYAATHNVPNGIACPLCGEELLDNDRNTIYTSSPPMLRTHCSKCDYSGYRYC